MEMAAKTWKGRVVEVGGGGTVWNAMTYDPEFNRVYLGTGNGALESRCAVPAVATICSCVRWSRSMPTPANTLALPDDAGRGLGLQLRHGHGARHLDIDATRKVLMHAPKNGFFYVLDRENGKLISAEKFGKVTWAERVDPATGRPVVAPGARYERAGAVWPGSGACTTGTHVVQPEDRARLRPHDRDGRDYDEGHQPRLEAVDRIRPVHGLPKHRCRSAGRPGTVRSWLGPGQDATPAWRIRHRAPQRRHHHHSRRPRVPGPRRRLHQAYAATTAGAVDVRRRHGSARHADHFHWEGSNTSRC